MNTRKKHLLMVINEKECELCVEFDGLEFIIQTGYNLDDDIELTDEQLNSIEQDELSLKWHGI